MFVTLIIGISGIGFLLSAIFNWKLPLRSTNRIVRAIAGIITLSLSISCWKINYTETSMLYIVAGVVVLLFAVFDWRELNKNFRVASAILGLIFLIYPVFEKMFGETIALFIWMGMFGLLYLLCGVFNWGIVYWSGKKIKGLRIFAIIFGLIVLLIWALLINDSLK